MKTPLVNIKILSVSALLILTIFTAQGQSVTTVMLREFVRDVKDSTLTNTELADKYFCTNILHLNDSIGNAARSGIEFALSNQRKHLRRQLFNTDKYSFKAFNQLSRKEIPHKPFHMLHETLNVYVLLHKHQPTLFFLLNGDKIASTLLIGQGDEHYFVDFCH